MPHRHKAEKHADQKYWAKLVTKLLPNTKVVENLFSMFRKVCTQFESITLYCNSLNFRYLFRISFLKFDFFRYSFVTLSFFAPVFVCLMVGWLRTTWNNRSIDLLMFYFLLHFTYLLIWMLPKYTMNGNCTVIVLLFFRTKWNPKNLFTTMYLCYAYGCRCSFLSFFSLVFSFFLSLQNETNKNGQMLPI